MHEIYDSFSGLSLPTELDKIKDEKTTAAIGDVGGVSGEFATNVLMVKNSLQEFPKLSFYQGWIPEVFQSNKNPDSKYKFVHIDVDLFEPTYTSLHYFHPRMTIGGVLCVMIMGH